ncbi:MAG: molecular chaperone DnaJ [Myxococcaceae bacterium]|nr:molecular chaperone DnaJ [Myxococcaceae bacterium]MCI0668840.1 molecular chaperone DnaJ [Myxococcaceae bacterium]
MAKGDKGPRAPGMSEQMREAWRLYDAGDKVRARQEAEQVLAGTPPGGDATQARELLERTAFPRTIFAFAGFALAVIVLLVALATVRS